MITTWAVRLIGLIIAVVGLMLALAGVGVATGVHVPVAWWIEIIIGLLFIGAGVLVIRGETITL